MSSTSAIPCSLCHKTYSRPEHLQRHLLAHSTARPFSCGACGKAFKRKDVLKRHRETCRRRWSAGMADGESPLKLKTASVAQQLGHSQNDAHEQQQQQQPPPPLTPIDMYREPDEMWKYINSIDSTPAPESDQSSSSNRRAMTLRRSRTYSEGSFGFLERFTRSSTVGLIDSFSMVEESHRSEQDRGMYRCASVDEDPWGTPTLSELQFGSLIQPSFGGGLFPVFPDPQRKRAGTDWQPESRTGKMPRLVDERLAIKSHEIVQGLKEVAIASGKSSKLSGGWSAIMEQLCADFFGPEQLSLLLDYFWDGWYPNWPVIHKPTFNALAMPRSLLAGMALIGACVSGDQVLRDRARTWFNLAEEMAFQDEEVLTDSCSECSNLRLPDRLRHLQAIYAVCLYQNWEGAEKDKSRVRRQRYSTVVATARQLMPYCNHEHGTFSPDLRSWHRFVVKEELIRSVLYVFLLDSAFVIFNNHPPRLTLRELSLDLACSENVFQAEKARDWYAVLEPQNDYGVSSARRSLYNTIKEFRKPSIDDACLQSLSAIGTLNLWVVVHAFHNLLFNLDLAFGSASQFEAIRKVIDNWDAVWSRHKQNMAFTFKLAEEELMCRTEHGGSWKRTGFMRHAREYCLLARVLLDHLESIYHSSKATDELPGSDSWKLSFAAPVMPKYDTTSMDQLNEFINSFQSLAVGEL